MVSFDRAVDFYDETRGFPQGVAEEAAKVIYQAGNFSPSTRLIEIGIGTGRIALPLASHVQAIHGVDLSGGMLTRLREKQQTEPVYVAQGVAEKLPYPDQYFDAAVVVHVFHLVQDLDEVERELRRVLKPNGVLVHCWNTNDPTFGALRKIGYEAVYETPEDRTNWTKSRQFYETYHWQEINRVTFTYHKQQSPADFIEKFRSRIWSHTWKWTDEQLERGIAAMQATIQAHYDDPNQPITEVHEFNAIAYRPI